MTLQDKPAQEYYLSSLANGWTVGRFAALDRFAELAHVVTTCDGFDCQMAKSDRERAAGQVAAATGLRSVAYCKQVHGTKVHYVCGGGFAGEGDGLVTAAGGVGVMGFSADCPLILAVEPSLGVVGMAHASWRATVGRIAIQLVGAMAARFAVKPAGVIACICPSAGPCCYEVGQDVVQAATGGIGPHAVKFFAARGGKTYFDLWAANADQLQYAGLDPANIHVARVCTICGGDAYPSFRRQGGQAGRFVAAIGMKA